MEDDSCDLTIEVENSEDQYIIQDVSRDLFSFKIKPLITSTPEKSNAITDSVRKLKLLISLHSCQCPSILVVAKFEKQSVSLQHHSSRNKCGRTSTRNGG